MGLYIGPSYIGDPFLHPSRRAAPAFAPAPVSRASTPIVRLEAADNMVAAVHEAAHAAHSFFTRRGIGSAMIDGRGGGRFRPHVGADVAPLLTGREPPVSVAADAKAKREWCDLLVGMAAPKFAQWKYGTSSSDDICHHDYLTIDRVLTSIASSPSEKREMLLGIERRALGFVLRRWNAIYALAKELYARGNLGRSEIARVLERATITLNENAAETAYGLISAGLINTGGFAWNDETDAEEEYGLGVDAPKDGTTPKYFYPFGKDGEVYVAALEDAIANGPPVVAAYAKQLLDHIQKQKKQSLENTTRPRGHGRDPDIRYRFGDGYLVPFSR